MLREGAGRDGTLWADGITVDDFGQGLSDRHAQRAITKMRERPRALNYLNEVLHRPSMDPHRVSYLEVSRKDAGAATDGAFDVAVGAPAAVLLPAPQSSGSRASA